MDIQLIIPGLFKTERIKFQGEHCVVLRLLDNTSHVITSPEPLNDLNKNEIHVLFPVGQINEVIEAFLSSLSFVEKLEMIGLAATTND